MARYVVCIWEMRFIILATLPQGTDCIRELDIFLDIGFILD